MHHGLRSEVSYRIVYTSGYQRGRRRSSYRGGEHNIYILYLHKNLKTEIQMLC